ncbi:MAG TPA: hypothetical protein VI386_24750 [Candidatus Sulfotelmatobacter sp.]
MRQTTTLVIIALTLALCAGTAAAQAPPADTLKVDYFSNANTTGAPDGTLRLTNPGTAPGNVCANIFVFDPFQELSECCSCFLSPDGLRTLSVNTDLTANPLTGKNTTLSTGVIKIVSTTLTAGTCPLPTNLNPIPALRAWTTHIQNAGFAVTETASQDATLSAAEVSRLKSECNAVRIVGSGAGVCSCGTGD